MIGKTLGLMAFGLGIVVATGACSDDGPEAKYPSVDSFCAAKAKEECKVPTQACGVAVNVCETKRIDVCRAAAATAAGQGRTYTSSRAEACIARVPGAYAERFVNETKEADLKDTCERVFAGSKARNAPCASLYECSGTLICDLTHGPVCAEKSAEKKVDEPCGNPGDVCGKGLFCQQRTGIQICTARAKAGAACDAATNPCEEALRCEQTCVSRKTAGDACTTNDECISNLCNADKKCIARSFPSETGGCADFGGI